jgi:hypothetical protein
MRNRMARAERRACNYEDRIRGFIGLKHTHLAVNAAIAHLQGELSKTRRYRVVRGERLDVALAGIIERLAQEVPGILVESTRDTNTGWSLLTIFERALKSGEVDAVEDPLPYRGEMSPLGGSTHP